MQNNIISEKLKRHVIRHDNQGYALYFKYNDIRVEETNGVLNLDDGKNIPITFDSHFRLASVTKQFIACGIIKLINKGLLKYETTVLEIFPDLPDYLGKVQIINLLNHTSGLYDYEDWEHEENAPQVLDHDIIDFLKTTDKGYFEVGEKYQYSNTAYVLLGDIIEVISGKTLEQYMKEDVFEPAGLLDTLVNIEGKTKIKNRAMGHVEKKDGTLMMKDQYWCSATIGDGGIYSTVNDLRKWIKYYRSEEAKYLNDTMFSKQREVAKGYYYGMGMRTIVLENGQEIYYHCGDTIGTDTIFIFSKDLDLECVFLTNFGHTDTSLLKDNILEIIKNDVKMR